MCEYNKVGERLSECYWIYSYVTVFEDALNMKQNLRIEEDIYLGFYSSNIDHRLKI